MTTATVDMVDAKDKAVKAELRLDIAQAVSNVLIAIEKQGKELSSAIERQNTAIEKQNGTINAAIERQNAAIERQNADLFRRLAAAAYWMFGVIAAGHLATISIVIAVID